MEIDKNTLIKIGKVFQEWNDAIGIDDVYDEKGNECLELLKPLFIKKYFEKQLQDNTQTTCYFYVTGIRVFDNGIISLKGPIVGISKKSVSFNQFGIYEDMFCLRGKKRNAAFKSLNPINKETFEKKMNYAKTYTDVLIENYHRIDVTKI